MKIILILMVLVLGAGVKAESINRDELFSTQENERVLKAIDFICGDIWCEGYYDYKFLNFTCDKKNHQCELTFQFRETFENNRELFSPVQMCILPGVYNLGQIFSDKNSELLKFKFIDKLSNCFDILADNFRKQ
jgi:hypothetical protein